MAVADTINSIKTHLGEAYASLEEKGATLPANKNIENLADSILSISGGGERVHYIEDDVIFTDFTGEIVYSCNRYDFAKMTEMPAQPVRRALVATGWNWTLEEAKRCVERHGEIIIGGMYAVDDNTSRIYIALQPYALSPTLGISVNGTVTIDWGDLTSEQVTGTSTTTPIYISHTYPEVGKYIIKLSSDSPIYFNGASSSGSYLLGTGGSTSSTNAVYSYNVYRVDLHNVVLGDYALAGLVNLKQIVFSGNTNLGGAGTYRYVPTENLIINNNITTITSSVFAFSDIKNIILPETITTISNGGFYACNEAIKLFFSSHLTSVADSAFKSCASLEMVALPETITRGMNSMFEDAGHLRGLNVYQFTSIYAYCFRTTKITYAKINPSVPTLSRYAFGDCYALQVVDFREHKSVPTLSETSAFSNLPANAKIVVPDALYDTWKTSGYWANASIVDKIIKASDFVE